MTSAWSDLDRPPLSQRRLAAVVRDGRLWTDVRLVPSTSSTNADVAAAARAGAPEGLVVVAEEQTSGRGRLDRRWESPPRAGILMSVLLRPALPVTALPLLPLVMGVAVAEAMRSVAGLDASLKWPNDVLVNERKVCGVLAERIDDFVVMGVGANVSTRADELPRSPHPSAMAATSVALEGGLADREPLIKEILRAFARRYLEFVAADGAPQPALVAYRTLCGTIGRQITIHVPGGERAVGLAIAVDDEGRLEVRDNHGTQRSWSAGEVEHVRSEG